MSAVTIRQQPGCLIQILWFVFIGWWLGAAVIQLAYSCFVFVITIPAGIWLINRLPLAMALRQPPVVIVGDRIAHPEQHNILLRALWFVFIGWWATFLWLNVAYFLCATIIGLPLGFVMFDATPKVLTLERQP